METTVDEIAAARFMKNLETDQPPTVEECLHRALKDSEGMSQVVILLHEPSIGKMTFISNTERLESLGLLSLATKLS